MCFSEQVNEQVGLRNYSAIFKKNYFQNALHRDTLIFETGKSPLLTNSGTLSSNRRDTEEGRKQNTKRSRYTTLSAFFNLITNTLLPEMRNSCQTTAARNLFRKPKVYPYTIFDKDVVDEAIFRTLNNRNRIILELIVQDCPALIGHQILAFQGAGKE